ncbi:MAG: hypothetical protein PF961_20320 [Planctomycetota bacterium]|nr:hypothetical protein [Planctomycetota bacterium]
MAATTSFPAVRAARFSDWITAAVEQASHHFAIGILGLASTANFCCVLKRITPMSPGSYRQYG